MDPFQLCKLLWLWNISPVSQSSSLVVFVFQERGPSLLTTLWSLHGHTSGPKAQQFKGYDHRRNIHVTFLQKQRWQWTEDKRTALSWETRCLFNPQDWNILHSRDFIYICVYLQIQKRHISLLVNLWWFGTFYLKYWAFCVSSHEEPQMCLISAPKQAYGHASELQSKYEGWGEGRGGGYVGLQIRNFNTRVHSWFCFMIHLCDESV